MRKISFIVFFLVVALGQGCAQKTIKSETTASDSTNRDATTESNPPAEAQSHSGELVENYGPQPQTDTPHDVEMQGPRPLEQPGLVIVIPSGLVKGASSAGVLKYLNRAKIKIRGIVATEMGAWMGALFAVSGTTNSVEWQLTQAKRAGEEGWRFSDVSVMIKKSLKKKMFRETKIPIVILSDEGVYSDGILSDAVISAVKNTTEKKFPMIQVALDQLVKTAKEKFSGAPVVVVKTAPDMENVADLAIHPKLDRVDDYDFKSIPEAVFQGETASAQAKEELFRLSSGQGSEP